MISRSIGMSLFVYHTVKSPPTQYLRPEDGPVQGLKHVVYLIIKLHHLISCVLTLLPLPSYWILTQWGCRNLRLIS